MFETPTRNHFSIVLERAGAVLAIVAVYFTNYLKDYGWEIFTLDFYKELYNTARYDASSRTMLIGGIIVAFMLWYIYISIRYWRRTTFYIDNVDFVYERKTMFTAASRLPIHNIAVVNVERSVFERLMGTAKVKIDLNSSKTASSTDFKFVLKAAEAQQLKERLMQIKQTLAEEEQGTTAQVEEEGEARELVASFTMVEALRHKLLSLPVISLLITGAILFILPQLKVNGDYDMSRLWYLLLIAVLGQIAAIIKGMLNLGDYKVERDSNMVYISCGILNKKNYLFELEKINAVMITQPLLARFFGMASIDLAVVGFGNEKNETTHLSLIADKEQIQNILKLCVPEFSVEMSTQHAHPIGLIYTILRSAVYGALCLLLRNVYKDALVIAIIVFAVSAIGALLEYFVSRFSCDENIVRYTGGMFTKKTCTFKYGDIQSMGVDSNILYRKLGLGKLRFSILGASAVRLHKTAVFHTEPFDYASAQMVAHEDNVLREKYKKQ